MKIVDAVDDIQTKYDLGDGLKREFDESANTTEGTDSNVVYNLSNLSIRRPGPVLVVGYGNPLKATIKAAQTFDVKPLISTSTDDKMKAFTFGGTTDTASVGEKFDPKLFSNEFAVLCAAQRSGARSILCASNVAPSNLLAQECIRRNILLLVPVEGDKTLGLWRRIVPLGQANDDEALALLRDKLPDVNWKKCNNCGFTHDSRDIVSNGYKCPNCHKLVRLTSDERILLTFDKDSVEFWNENTPQTNGLDFPEFDAIINRAKERSGYDEGVVVGCASIEGIDCAFGIMEPSFMMGSMGHVVGEKLASMFELATDLRLPVVVFCASGGARMQEGLVSLMQMAKVSAAVKKHSDAGLLYVSVLSDPTTGGVTASFAMLGDIIIAEPGAIIGFAGRRVIKDTIKQALPDDFQTAEFALEHGQIDAIVPREKLRPELANILKLHGYENSHNYNDDATQTENISTDTNSEQMFDNSQQLLSGEKHHADPIGKVTDGLKGLAGAFGHAISESAEHASQLWKLHNQGVADIPYVKPGKPLDIDVNNDAWASVQNARNTNRPTSSYYISALFDDFIELHGDRVFADDGAIIGGIGRIGDQVVTVIAEEKGIDLKDRIARNFGCPQPEGYRKSMRLMDQAEKFGRPIVCLVDTQGAYCGKEAEERGIGGTIAESLAKMSTLSVPVISVVIGEGGSGGALALAVANKVAMQENAVYSVLSPEGFASILWKDGTRAPEAAAVMKVSAKNALDMGIIEDVIVEGQEAAHINPDQAAAALWLYINYTLADLSKLSPEQLKNQRYERFRKF